MGRPSYFGGPDTWADRQAALANCSRNADVQARKAANRVRDYQVLRKRQKQNRILAVTGARFSPETHQRLQSAIMGICSTRRAATPEPWAAFDILSRKLDTGETDEVVILPSVEEARALVKVLRAPGVNGFCHGLEALERIAETPEPTARGFRLQEAEFFAALRLVEKDKAHVPRRASFSRLNPPKVTDGTIYSILSDVKDPKRFEAAAILRAVVIKRGNPQIHLTQAEAILLLEVLTDLNAERGLIASVKDIAEREPAEAA